MTVRDYESAGEAVRQAAELLRTRGWAQGRAQDSQGRLCLWGAILVATALQQDRLTVRDEAVSGVDRVVVEQYPERLGGSYAYAAIQFNDNPVTCLDEVLAVLDKAAVLADEEAGK